MSRSFTISDASNDADHSTLDGGSVGSISLILALPVPLFSEWPVPISDLLGIDAELVRVVFAFYLLVEQKFSNLRAGNVEARDPIDRVNREAESIRLVLNCQLQRSIDIALFLVPAYVNMVLARAAVRESVNKPGIGVKIKDYRFVWRE